MESPNNPVPSVINLNRSPNEPIVLEDLSHEVIALLEPQRAARPEQPRRGSRSNPVIVIAETHHERVMESPASPDPSPATSPVDTPTRRTIPSPAASPSKLSCESPLYIPLQDHQFAVPQDCPIAVSPTLRDPSIGMTGEVWPAQPTRPQRRRASSPPTTSVAVSPTLPSIGMTGAPNPHAQRPQPTRPQRRRAPSSPTPEPQRGRTTPRPTPYATPPSRFQPSAIPGEGSAFSSHTFPRSRARNLLSDFAASLPSLLVPRVPSPRPRSPSPDILLEFYTHTRHPLNLKKHLTILPSWGMKSEEERKGECVICYGLEEHLQVKCKSCGTMKVCCCCIVRVCQSLNTCPMCRFRGEY